MESAAFGAPIGQGASPVGDDGCPGFTPVGRQGSGRGPSSIRFLRPISADAPCRATSAFYPRDANCRGYIATPGARFAGWKPARGWPHWLLPCLPPSFCRWLHYIVCTPAWHVATQNYCAVAATSTWMTLYCFVSWSGVPLPGVGRWQPRSSLLPIPAPRPWAYACGR